MKIKGIPDKKINIVHNYPRDTDNMTGTNHNYPRDADKMLRAFYSITPDIDNMLRDFYIVSRYFEWSCSAITK